MHVIARSVERDEAISAPDKDSRLRLLRYARNDDFLTR